MCCSFACSQILCGYIYDTVCIDIECNLNLRNTSSCRKDTIQTELAKGLVVSCKLSLTLYNVDIYSGLVISCGGEDLALLGRDSSYFSRSVLLQYHPWSRWTGTAVLHPEEESHPHRHRLQAYHPEWKHRWLRTHPGLMICSALCLSAVLPYPVQPGYVWIHLLTVPDSDQLVRPASFIAFCTGIAVFSTRSCVSSSNFALVRFISKCFGPSAVAVMNGRLMLVVVAEESSFFAFSAASFQSLKCHLICGKVYALCLLELIDHPLGNTVIEVIAAQGVYRRWLPEPR